MKFLNCTLAIDCDEGVSDEDILKAMEQRVAGMSLIHKSHGGAMIDDVADMKFQPELHKEDGDE